MDSLYVQYLGHWGGAFCVAISNKDDIVLTGGADCTCRIYDATSGNEVKRIEGHVEAVLKVNFSLDNKKIITSSADMTAIIWDIVTGDQVTRLEGHDGEVLDGIFLSSSLALTASNDSSLRTWRVDTGQLVTIFCGHKSAVTCCISMAKGIQAVSSSFDKTIRIWEISSGMELLMLTGHVGVIYHIDLSRDQRKLLSCASDEMVKVWNLDEGLEIETLHLHEYAVTACSFDPTGSWIVTGGIDKTVRLFELSSSGDAVIVGEHKAAVCSIKFSNDGEFILSAGADGVISKWEWAVAHQVATDSTPDHTAPICHVEFSSTGKHCISLSVDGVSIIRVLDWRCVSLAAHQLTDEKDPATACKFAPNGLTVATLHAFGCLLWDTKTGTIVGRFAQVFNLLSLEFPDEIEYAIARPQSPLVRPDGDVAAAAAQEALDAQDPNAFNQAQMEIFRKHAQNRHKKRFRADYLAIAREIDHLEGGRGVDWKDIREELDKLVKEEDRKAVDAAQRKQDEELEARKLQKQQEIAQIKHRAAEVKILAASEAEAAIERLMSDFRFCEDCGVPWVADSKECSTCNYSGRSDALTIDFGACTKCESVWIRDGKFCHRCGSARDRDAEDDARELGIVDHEPDSVLPASSGLNITSTTKNPDDMFANGLAIWFDALHRIVTGTTDEVAVVRRLVQADTDILAQGKLNAEISVFGRELTANERDAFDWNVEATSSAPIREEAELKERIEAKSAESTPALANVEEITSDKDAPTRGTEIPEPVTKKSMFSSTAAKGALASMGMNMKLTFGKKKKRELSENAQNKDDKNSLENMSTDNAEQHKETHQPKVTKLTAKQSKPKESGNKKRSAAAELKAKAASRRALVDEMLKADAEVAVFGYELGEDARDAEWQVPMSCSVMMIIAFITTKPSLVSFLGSICSDLAGFEALYNRATVS